MDALEGRVAGVVGAGLHGVGADDRAQHADAADQQREDDALVAEGGHAQDHGRDDGDLVGLEDVGRHAGAVADVVAHVVRDGGGVARVVLGDVLLDLADQVGADVGRLGVDAAADPHEEGEQRAAEAEAEQGLVGVGAVDQEDEGAAQQAEAVGEHAGDGAGAVAELHGLAVAVLGGGGDAQVAGGGEPHADEADRPAEDRAHQEGGGAPVAEGVDGARVGDPEQDGDDDDEREDPLHLRVQVGVRALADRVRDGLHLGRALVGLAHLLGKQQRVEEAGDRNHEDREDAHLLERREMQRREELEGALGAFARGERVGGAEGQHHGDQIQLAPAGRVHQPAEPVSKHEGSWGSIGYGVSERQWARAPAWTAGTSAAKHRFWATGAAPFAPLRPNAPSHVNPRASRSQPGGTLPPIAASFRGCSRAADCRARGRTAHAPKVRPAGGAGMCRTA